jgi:osmoprotectant transport system permease protein
VLALVVEGVLEVVQRLAVSPGLRNAATRRRTARIWRKPTPELVGKST